jgi:hypothetical protein
MTAEFTITHTVYVDALNPVRVEPEVVAGKHRSTRWRRAVWVDVANADDVTVEAIGRHGVEVYTRRQRRDRWLRDRAS